MTCGDMLDFDDWWFVCSLDDGHPGDHQATSDPDEAALRPAYVVRWAAEALTVAGQVIG